MYRVCKSIDIDFTHHIRGHAGSCINLHGHTWKFEVGLRADTLSDVGFVLDFKDLKQRVLKPCHDLLDHSLVVGRSTFAPIEPELTRIGEEFLSTREPYHGTRDTQPRESMELHGAQNIYPGGLKVTLYPFSHTSERLSRWLYDLAQAQLASERVQVDFAKVYETLHPVESVAEYRP